MLATRQDAPDDSRAAAAASPAQRGAGARADRRAGAACAKRATAPTACCSATARRPCGFATTSSDAAGVRRHACSSADRPAATTKPSPAPCTINRARASRAIICVNCLVADVRRLASSGETGDERRTSLDKLRLAERRHAVCWKASSICPRNHSGSWSSGFARWTTARQSAAPAERRRAGDRRRRRGTSTKTLPRAA